jgi:predicted TIM-barrel fold metal-dependent hydrolase
MSPRLLLPISSILILSACATAGTGASRAAIVPRVDYHQHLVSADFAPIAKLPMRDGKALLAELDAAGIEKAVVLSVGYTYGDERKHIPDPDRVTRRENDWTSAQVSASGGRLIGFCSANPLRPAALGEIDRCLALPGMRGIKLHLGNGGITLRDPSHAARVAEVFALAERRGAPVLVHMRARGGRNYGAEDARLFLDRLVAVAPSIDVVVAHLGGSGPGYDAQTDTVMAEFGAAADRHDPRMRHVYFDVASNVAEETTPPEAALIARRIRQVGPTHVLYGSDLSVPGGSIQAGWALFRTRVPLTESEMRTIAGNVTRFAR